MLNVELHRKLAWSQCVDDQLCSITEKPIDNDLDLARRAHVFQLPALFLGREVQQQSFRVNGIDVHGRTKKIHHAGAKPEFRNCDERLNSHLVSIRVGVSIEPEPLARNLEAPKHRHMESVELNLAVKSSGQRLGYAFPKDRFRMRD